MTDRCTDPTCQEHWPTYTNDSIEYGQIPVRFENDLNWTRCYCYPINLEVSDERP